VKAIESGAHRCQLRSIADSHGGNDEQVGGAVGENSSRARERATVRERERERENATRSRSRHRHRNWAFLEARTGRRIKAYPVKS